jgi:hypothetical protein
VKRTAANTVAHALAALATALLLLAAGSAEASRYLSLRVLVVLYPHTFADLATPQEDARVFEAVDGAVEHFWRGSRMRLHLAPRRSGGTWPRKSSGRSRRSATGSTARPATTRR